MVRWFAPRQLWTSGLQIFGARMRGDYRIIESLEAEQPAYDHAGDGELWIDYVADMGDGFDSAFGVARQIARDRIDVAGAGRPLAGGQILIMGGDQCYPVASRDGYRRRLALPYENAFTGAERDLYVLPGNHDWYDGLTAFMRRFCQQRRLGSLRTRQTRSYFALRLPSDWWLLGIDLQLGADIDRPQSRYFREHALDHMREGHRVIVCTAEPGWLSEPGSDEMRNFRFIQQQVHATGARIHLWLSGDLHHYMRQRPGSTALAGETVTAGGGGAFLHPTHVIPRGRPAPVCCYPEAGISRRLALGNVAFAARNWELGPVIGAVYAVLGAAVTTPHAASTQTGALGLHEAFHAGVTALFGHPFALLCAGLVLAACFAVGERGRWYRRVSSLVHGLTHVGAAMLIAHLAIHATAALDVDTAGLAYLSTAGITIAGGAIVGLFITSVYFTVSGVLGKGPNNSFAALRIASYKSWVRLHLGADGSLDLYAIGLRDVPRRWRRDPDAAPGQPRVVPDGRDIPPHLIEKVPIAGPRPGPRGG